MEEIISRIKEYIDYRKISVRAFAKEIGDMSPQTVGQYLNGKRSSVSLEFVYKILKADERLSAEWLLRGRGDMYKIDSNEYTKELAAMKVRMLAQDGVIDRLTKIIESRMQK